MDMNQTPKPGSKPTYTWPQMYFWGPKAWEEFDKAIKTKALKWGITITK